MLRTSCSLVALRPVARYPIVHLSRLARLQPWGADATVPNPDEGGLIPTPHKEFLIRHTSPGVGRLTDLVITEGKGAYVRTDAGQALLDMTTGIGVTCLGHAHPEVVEAVSKQAADINHAQVNIAWHAKQLELVETFVEDKWFPSDLDRYFFWNSGAEAVEAAIKLARHATKRPNIVVFQGGYHGRTIGSMSLTTSKTGYRAGFGPLMPGVFTVPFPYWHARGSTGPCEPDNLQAMGDECIAQLELLLRQQSAPDETAAVIIEPIQGEGGYVPSPPQFLQGLQQICQRHGILFVADEVQSGFMRTGDKFAVNHDAVVPDIMVFAKGVANGYPLSGIASRFDLMDTQPAGSMGGTYAGNAVACAAAVATLKVLNRPETRTNVLARSQQLILGLKALAADPEIANSQNARICDIRGRGLMVGVELGTPKASSDAATGAAAATSRECASRGMLVLSTGVYDTLRFIPPLNVTEAEIDLALEIFGDALRAVARSS